MDQTIINHEQWDELIGLIYEGPLEESPWSQSLGLIREYLRANHATLIVRPTTPDSPGLIINAGESTADQISAYNNYFFGMEPFTGLPVDSVMATDELFSEEEWLQSPYLNEFLISLDIYHLIGANLRLPDGAICGIRAGRPQSAPAFSSPEKSFIEKLLPHLRRSMTLYTRMGRMQSVGNLYAQTVDRMMIGTVILDEHGKVFQSNQVAEELLDTGESLRRNGQRLQAVFGPEDRQLQRLIKEAINLSVKPEPTVIGTMSLVRPSGEGNLGVVVRSVPMTVWAESNRRPAVAVFLRDPEKATKAPQEAVRQLFNLTPAETTLVMKLVNGFTLDEAAEQLDIKRNTARAHLRAIFSKTGVTRQTELVRLMLNSVVTLIGVDDVEPV